MCSDLCKRGIVDAVLSEDTDVLAYGAPLFLTKIDTTADTCVRISYPDILSNLDLTKEQFLDICIMCGCDYNQNIPKIGSETAYKYIKKYGSIEGIEKNTSHDTSILNYIRTRDIFLNYPHHELKTVPYCGSPNFQELEKFVTENTLNICFKNLEKCFIITLI